MVKIALRWSGVALVAASLVAGVALLQVSLGLPGRYPDRPGSLLLLVGSLLLMLALPGMYARQAEASGWLGLVSHVLLALGNVLVIGFATAVLFNPSLTGRSPEGDSTALALAVVLLLGFLLTAAAMLRAAVYPRGAGILLLVAGVGFLLVFFVAYALPPLAQALIGALEGLVQAVALAWIGVALVRGTSQRAT